MFDDCSEDGTYHKLKDIIANSPDLEMLLMHSQCRIGKGGSIKKAVEIALGETVLIMDADLSADLSCIQEMIRKANETKGVVIGQRDTADRFTQGIFRVVLSLAYNALVRLLFQTGISDHQCGFKAMKTSVARKLMSKMRSTGFVFDTELIVAAKKSGIPVQKEKITWTDNRPRRTNLKWLRTSITMARELFNLRRTCVR